MKFLDPRRRETPRLFQYQCRPSFSALASHPRIGLLIEELLVARRCLRRRLLPHYRYCSCLDWRLLLQGQVAQVLLEICSSQGLVALPLSLDLTTLLAPFRLWALIDHWWRPF